MKINRMLIFLILYWMCISAMEPEVKKDDPYHNWRNFMGMTCKDLSDPILQRLLKMTFKYAYIHGDKLYEKMKRLSIDENHFRIKNILYKYPQLDNQKYRNLLQAQCDVEAGILRCACSQFTLNAASAIEQIESQINYGYLDAQEANKHGYANGGMQYGHAIDNFEKIVQDTLRSGEQKEPAASAFMPFLP